MPESFPSTPRAPVAVRAGAVVIAVIGLAIAARTTTTSLRWVDRTFPGFMLLDNRVVASVGLAHWTGSAVPGLFQSELLGVNGRSVHSTPAAYEIVTALPPNTPVEYLTQGADGERRLTIATQRFTIQDWCLLFGVYLLNGVVFLACGVVVWVLRPETPMARALLATGTTTALFLFTAMDLYGPATFFRLHVLCEALMSGAFLHLALVFPRPHRFSHMRFAGYALSLALATPYELFLYNPIEYPRILRTSVLYLGLVAVFFCLRLVVTYWRGTSQLARQRVRVIMLGTLAGFALPAVVLTLAAVMAGGVAMNTAALTPFVFSVALAYAVVKHDLFEIDAMVKRGAYYLVLTTAVGAAYVLAVLGFDYVLQLGAVTDTAASRSSSRSRCCSCSIRCARACRRSSTASSSARATRRPGARRGRRRPRRRRSPASTSRRSSAPQRRRDPAERGDAALRRAPTATFTRSAATWSCRRRVFDRARRRPTPHRVRLARELRRTRRATRRCARGLGALDADVAVPLVGARRARRRAHGRSEAVAALLHGGRRRVPARARAPGGDRARERGVVRGARRR